MNTKTIKYFTATLFAYLIACAVILSHTHAADVLRHSVSSLPSATTKAGTDTPAKTGTTDTPTKIGGELHTHVDKTMVKNIMKSVTDTVAARRHELEKSEISDEESLLDKLLDNLLMMRIAMTLPVSVQLT